MSTKVYQAYRISVKNFFNCYEALLNQASDLGYATIVKTFKPTSKSSSDLIKHVNTIKEQAKEAARDSSRSSYDFQLSLHIREYKGNFYIIPYGDMFFKSIWQTVFENFSGEFEIEDYSYWNNSDRPEDITGRAWAARGTTWNEIDSRPILTVYANGFNPQSYSYLKDLLTQYEGSK